MSLCGGFFDDSAGTHRTLRGEREKRRGERERERETTNTHTERVPPVQLN